MCGGGGGGVLLNFFFYFLSFKGDIQLKMACLDYFEGYTGKFHILVYIVSLLVLSFLEWEGLVIYIQIIETGPALIQVKMFILYPLFYPLIKGSYLRLFMVI